MLLNTFQRIYKKLKRDARIKSPGSFHISKKLTISDYTALAIATCGGVGYIPIVPATWGSLLGVGIYFLAQKFYWIFFFLPGAFGSSNPLTNTIQSSLIGVALIFLLLVGTWSASRVEVLTEKKDPSIVVIDEVLGQLLVFLFVPSILGLWSIIGAFLLFRLFDIWKLYPANKLEALPNGLGVMADDVMAGFYAGALISVLSSVYLFFFLN